MVFAISIILFSLIIDKVGYKTAMIFSFVCYAAYAGLAFMAHGIVTGAEGEALADAQKQAYNYWVRWFDHFRVRQWHRGGLH